MVTSSLIRLHLKSPYRYTKRWAPFYSSLSFLKLLGQLYRVEEEVLSVVLFQSFLVVSLESCDRVRANDVK